MIDGPLSAYSWMTFRWLILIFKKKKKDDLRENLSFYLKKC